MIFHDGLLLVCDFARNEGFVLIMSMGRTVRLDRLAKSMEIQNRMPICWMGMKWLKSSPLNPRDTEAALITMALPVVPRISCKDSPDDSEVSERLKAASRCIA